MVLQVVLIFICVVLLGAVVRLWVMAGRMRDRIANLALKTKDLDQRIIRVDDATGNAIYQLKAELTKFKQDYGDAAIEEMKESAKAQKAFAEGLNSIMDYGAHLYDRGDDK